MTRLKIPRITVAGLKGGSGKTIFTLGLIGALRSKGMDVVPFKKGPDYIDAGWMTHAAGRPCYNLDPFLMTTDTILESFLSRGSSAEIAIIEGNRGLFDGVDESGTCSTAELAKLLKSPVILVIDCTKVTRTAAAMVLGCLNLDPDLNIAGVILNHVARARHEAMVTKTIEAYTGVKVMGVMPRMKGDPLPMRHLGVTPCDEHPEALAALKKLSRMIFESSNLDDLKSMARQAPPIETEECPSIDVKTCAHVMDHGESTPKIGIIRDQAFQFYYPENIEALERAGASIQYLNALNGTFPEDIDGLYIGGGFPETQAVKLSANRPFRKALLRAIEQGMPVYAECGGLMYLGDHIIWQHKTYPMVGAVSWDFVLGKRPIGHGYSVIEVESAQNPFFPKGTVLQGHEFHYSKPVASRGEKTGNLTCKVIRGHGFDGKAEGVTYKRLFGTYTHIHALECKNWGPSLVRLAMEFKLSKHEPDIQAPCGLYRHIPRDKRTKTEL